MLGRTKSLLLLLGLAAWSLAESSKESYVCPDAKAATTFRIGFLSTYGNAKVPKCRFVLIVYESN